MRTEKKKRFYGNMDKSGKNSTEHIGNTLTLEERILSGMYKAWWAKMPMK